MKIEFIFFGGLGEEKNNFNITYNRIKNRLNTLILKIHIKIVKAKNINGFKIFTIERLKLAVYVEKYVYCKLKL